MFSTLGRLVNAVQRNPVWCARCYLLIKLLDWLPLTFLVTIEVTIAYTTHVIPAFGFDSLKPGATKPGIGHQDRYTVRWQYEFKCIEQLPMALGTAFTVVYALLNRERSTGQRD